MLLGFEHVGMTVSNMDAAVAFYVDLLGLRLVVRRQSPEGNELCFLDAGGGMLEIAAPAAGAERAQDVARGHAGLRHLTFRFDNIEPVYAKLEAAGVEMIEAPRIAHNRDMLERVAFCRDPDGIIIELAERPVSPPNDA